MAIADDDRAVRGDDRDVGEVVGDRASTVPIAQGVAGDDGEPLVGDDQRGLGDGRHAEPAAHQAGHDLARLDAGDEVRRGERQHPAVDLAGRQHQQVGREPVAADVAGLPHPPRPHPFEFEGDRAPAQRAAGVVAAVGADQVDGSVSTSACVAGPGTRRCGCRRPAGSPARRATSTRHHDVVTDARSRASATATVWPRVAAVDVPPGPADRLQAQPGRGGELGRCARPRRGSARLSASPRGPHGPGCSTSSSRDAGGAVPSIGSPRSWACSAHRLADSRGTGRRPRRAEIGVPVIRSRRRPGAGSAWSAPGPGRPATGTTTPSRSSRPRQCQGVGPVEAREPARRRRRGRTAARRARRRWSAAARRSCRTPAA